MKKPVGESLGHDQLVSLLGKGSMSPLFKRRDVALQRDVAVKVVSPRYAESRVQASLCAGSAVRHPA